MADEEALPVIADGEESAKSQEVPAGMSELRIFGGSPQVGNGPQMQGMSKKLQLDDLVGAAKDLKLSDDLPAKFRMSQATSDYIKAQLSVIETPKALQTFMTFAAMGVEIDKLFPDGAVAVLDADNRLLRVIVFEGMK